MKNKKLNPSWERQRQDPVHSKEGIERLKYSVKYALQKKYYGLAETMFRYDGMDSPMLEDMQVMSADRMPEWTLFKNGMGTWFKDDKTEQIHFLPLVYKKDLNIYGIMVNWNPVPVGYVDAKKGEYGAEIQRIMSMDLNADNAVVMRNDLFGTSDEEFLDVMIDELIDNMLTVNQLQLLARSPIVFNITKDNEMSAKQYFHSIAEGEPVIFTNSLGDDITPAIEQTGVQIDPSVFEIFDRWECLILEHLGIDCVPITKRAQQTVSEVQSNDDKIRLRRLEKLNQREKAIDRVNKMFGTSITVVSVIDEQMEQQKQQMQQMIQEGGKDDGPEE